MQSNFFSKMQVEVPGWSHETVSGRTEIERWMLLLGPGRASAHRGSEVGYTLPICSENLVSTNEMAPSSGF